MKRATGGTTGAGGQGRLSLLRKAAGVGHMSTVEPAASTASSMWRMSS